MFVDVEAREHFCSSAKLLAQCVRLIPCVEHFCSSAKLLLQGEPSVWDLQVCSVAALETRLLPHVLTQLGVQLAAGDRRPRWGDSDPHGWTS